MEKLDTAETLHRIAAKMRVQAEQTGLPEYQCLMLRTAISLELEAERLDQLKCGTRDSAASLVH
jgi:hypothetical protein